VCIYIAALTSEDDARITLNNLPPQIRNTNLAASSQVPEQKTSTLLSRKITRETLEQAIIEYSGHRDSIAEHLGISRMTLWRKMKKFGLDTTNDSSAAQ
jgi:transcriptional regulator of acetoin/glycerol metabolism